MTRWQCHSASLHYAWKNSFKSGSSRDGSVLETRLAGSSWALKPCAASWSPLTQERFCWRRQPRGPDHDEFIVAPGQLAGCFFDVLSGRDDRGGLVVGHQLSDPGGQGVIVEVSKLVDQSGIGRALAGASGYGPGRRRPVIPGGPAAYRLGPR